jgi:cell division protein FtsB
MDNTYYRKDSSRRFGGAVKKLLRNRKLLFWIAAGIAVLLFVVLGNRGIVQRIALEREKVELEEKIRQTEAEGKELEKLSKKLDSDPQAIEKVAREKHNMVRKGDRVYKVNPEK